VSASGEHHTRVERQENDPVGFRGGELSGLVVLRVPPGETVLDHFEVDEPLAEVDWSFTPRGRSRTALWCIRDFLRAIGNTNVTRRA
jgi:hypothetical protein